MNKLFKKIGKVAGGYLEKGKQYKDPDVPRELYSTITSDSLTKSEKKRIQKAGFVRSKGDEYYPEHYTTIRNTKYGVVETLSLTKGQLKAFKAGEKEWRKSKTKRGK